MSHRDKIVATLAKRVNAPTLELAVEEIERRARHKKADQYTLALHEDNAKEIGDNAYRNRITPRRTL